MIRALEVINYKEQSLMLELTDPWTPGIAVTNIDGIGGGQADINTTDMATSDGAWFNSARMQTRTITITLKPMGPDVEHNRHTMYQYFPIKKPVTLRFLTDERDLLIHGYTETVETSIFSQQEAAQITVMCPDPYFYGETHSEESFSGVRPQFEFPFSSENVAMIPDRDEWYSNLIPNWDFTHPMNSLSVGNPNLLPLQDLRYSTEPIVQQETTGKWYLATEGKADITTDGVVLNRPLDLEPGWTTLRFKPSDIPNGSDCTFSFTSVEFGLLSLTVSKASGSATMNFGGDDQHKVDLLWTDSSFEVDISLTLGMTVTIVYVKLEVGTSQTLITSEAETSWHGQGPTIDNWTVTSSQYGNIQLDILKDNGGFRIQDYISNGEDFVMETPINLKRGEKITLSGLTKNNVYYKTYDVPMDGAIEFEDLVLEMQFKLRLHCEDGSEKATVDIYHPHGVGDHQITLLGVKVEYAEKQTLGKRSGNEWVIIQEPPGSDYYTNEKPIEFGRIAMDTRADLYYDGDIDIGMTLTIHMTGPAEMITVYNTLTGGTMLIDTNQIRSRTGVTLDMTDDIIINTTLGRRSAQLLHDAKYYNIIGAIGRGAEWFQLTPGDNIFAFTARSGEANVTLWVSYEEAYGGI